MDTYPPPQPPQQQTPQQMPPQQAPQPYYQQQQMQQAPQPYYQQQPSPYPQAYYPPQPPVPNPAERYEKDLRTRAMKITLSLFGFYFVNIISMLIVVVSSLILSGAFTDLISSAMESPEAYAQAYEDIIMDKASLGLASIVGIILGSLMLLITRGTRMFTQDLTSVNNRMNLPNLFKMLGLILGTSAVVSILTALFLLVQEALGFSGSDPLVDAVGALINPAGLLYVVLIGPVFEEIIFRGAILRTLVPFGQNFAIVVSALLFGLYHLILTQGIFAFFVGIVLAYCTLRYSIKWAMLLHILNNGLAMLITLWAPSLFVELGIYGLYLLFGIVALIFGLKTIREQLCTGKPTRISEVVDPLPMPALLGQTFGQQSYYAQPGMYPQQTEPKPRPWAITFTSPWLLVGLVIAGLISVAMIF